MISQEEGEKQGPSYRLRQERLSISLQRFLLVTIMKNAMCGAQESFFIFFSVGIRLSTEKVIVKFLNRLKREN